MIDDFVKAWDANKEKLSVYIASHHQEDYRNYKEIVTMLFKEVINPYMVAHDKPDFDLDKLHEIDDGEYQGTLLYLIPTSDYQPSYWEYVATYVYYGSCSGCDTLLGISEYGSGLPNREQVKEYMNLCLNILQHCKYLYKYGEEG